mmetsp:Transcript_46487/g.64595  ORF Transcript_46487/g.64595 Transcript_46487/m.64595 type:complete len:228 (-) Transcript_46487:96-779(-)
MSRPRAETIPAVTVPPRPNGLPIATTQSPTRSRSLSPNSTEGSCLPAGSILRTATSVFSSVPSSSALNSVSSCSRTVISSASAITWLLVTTMPAASMMKPEPSDCARRGRSGRGWLRSKNSSKKSLNGEPGGNCGMSGLRLESTVCVVAMLTTAGESWAARSAKLSGGAFASARPGDITPPPSIPAPRTTASAPAATLPRTRVIRPAEREPAGRDACSVSTLKSDGM